LLWRRPNSLGALLCAVAGSGFAAALHFSNALSWELATLVVVVVCVGLFVLPTRLVARAPEAEKVTAFFTRLERPLAPHEIPQLDPRFGTALGRLFGLSFVVAGTFFVVVSLLAIAALGGKLALIAGLACVIAGVVILRKARLAPAAVPLPA
jgi:hypothetical protein